MSEPPSIPSNPPRTLWRNLVELLRSRAAAEPERLAYRFLLDGESDEALVTYAELDRGARTAAARLQGATAAGERALILCQPGLNYVTAYFGCLYAGVVAVPVYAPHATRLERAVEKLRGIVRSCRPATLLTTAAYVPWAEALLLGDADFRGLRLVAVDALPAEAEAEWQPPAVEAETLAFLQYTSGSTAEPKGVMVSHGNLLHNLEMIRRGFGVGRDSSIVSWLPPYHDMGLIGGILQPLYAGAPATLMSPMQFLQRPLRWLAAVSRYGATISGGPNFAYDLCVQKCSAEDIAGLDLHRWQVAFNGAEPIRAETLERFAAAFAGSGFRRQAFFPCYGLAEATLMVSCGSPASEERFAAAALERDAAIAMPAEEPAVRRLVGSGAPADGLQVVIADPQTAEPRGDDAVGEIWVAGPSVAHGYWGRPDESEATFAARLAGGDGPFLRTGDLGFLHGGELFVTGRRKDLIIVRGRNLYPQDVERTVEACHPALRSAAGAAFAVEVAGEERLVVVHELARSQRRAPAEEVVAAVRAAVGAEHDVAVHAVALLKPGTLPKTSSGKVRRRATRDLFLAGELETLGGWEATPADAAATDGATMGGAAEEPLDNAAAIARWLRARVAARLGILAEAIAIEAPAARVGLDSLQAVEMTHEIERALGLPLPMETFLGEASLEQLAADLHARLLDREATAEAATIAASASTAATASTAASSVATASAATTPSADHQPSRGQRALWFLHQLAPESAAYNIARTLVVRGPLDADALERAFQLLVDRHPALRTTFAAAPEGPRATIADRLELKIERVHAAEWNEAIVAARLVEEAERPFDLERGPLLRISLLARSRGEHLLLVVVHHIVADFWSLALLLDELRLAYPAIAAGEAVALPARGGDYRHYVAWQEGMLGGADGEQLFAWWRDRLAAPPADLELPIDHPRPRVQGFRGGVSSFVVEPDVVRQLAALARAEGVTFYTLLLAAFQTLLHRYTGQTDLVVGSPTTGRSRAGFADVVGYFVNPLPLRADLAGDPPFLDLLRRVHGGVLDAFAHQDYPFPLLVERLQPERAGGRHPYFQTMFALQKAARLDELGLTALELGDRAAEMPVGDLTFAAWPLEQRIAQFELVLTMGECGDGMLGSFEYDSDLFAAPTVERLASHFSNLLASIAAGPEQPLSSLELLGEDEWRRALVDWNDTRLEQPPATLHGLFAAQAARTPDAIAVLADDGRALTYGELDARASVLAHRLRALGVGPEALVGIAVERSFEMLVGLLAILEAGGAYVPLDPGYPRDQLRLMVEDARLELLLTQSHLAAAMGELGPRLLLLDGPDSGLLTREAAPPLPDDVTEDNLAYVIFTSGSTGRPKGVMATHRGVCNHLRWMQSALPLHAGDRMLQKYSFNFDASVCELFAPLLAGASLLLARPGAQADAAYLVELVATRGVTVLDLVPALLEVLLDEPGFAACNKLRRVVCGGEALSASLRRRFAERCRAYGIDAELYNAYGPTEATIGSTCGRCDCEASDTPGATTPIGRPIANTTVYLLDDRMQPVPVGARGELYIGGTGVARGYLHNPAATAERFVPDAFSRKPGARLYRTGDLGRHLADGSIELFGRRDDQVKVRGFRVEPAEVEAALLAHERVREAVVLAADAPAGGKQLVAYVVPRAGAAPLLPGELRAHLEGRLPRPLLPAAYAVLDGLPLAPGGKVDRRALLRLPVVPVDGEASYAPPRHAVDEVVAALWVELLGVPRVGIADEFFALGGHSLLATQLVSRVRQLFGVELPLRALFEAPTVAGLADAILAAETQPGRSEKIARAFQRVQGMSAEEAKRLLAQKRAQQAPLELAKEPA
ncbi:MAG TPA: amino acid adenylation domain-containing protein [Thermoanaerobaculia bacterium]|jgi:amino acid adenylation domain-containing protein|nr:amino acid adenylation domain-containing protein [Thermoanaerobaculia bacterium]